VNQLIALTHYRLGEALEYTLMIPAREKPIRLFNLWSLGMAMLTLRNIYKQPGFRSGKDVKISRNSVRMMSILMKLLAGNNRMLKIWFYLAGRGLPHLNHAPAPLAPGQVQKKH
jgi:farnesyl-diphosphate farnesyltransferase